MFIKRIVAVAMIPLAFAAPLPNTERSAGSELGDSLAAPLAVRQVTGAVGSGSGGGGGSLLSGLPVLGPLLGGLVGGLPVLGGLLAKKQPDEILTKRIVGTPIDARQAPDLGSILAVIAILLNNLPGTAGAGGAGAAGGAGGAGGVLDLGGVTKVLPNV